MKRSCEEEGEASGSGDAPVLKKQKKTESTVFADTEVRVRVSNNEKHKDEWGMWVKRAEEWMVAMHELCVKNGGGQDIQFTRGETLRAHVKTSKARFTLVVEMAADVIGDIDIVLAHGDAEEVLTDVLERKLPADLLASHQDGRSLRQRRVMRAAGAPRTWMMFVDDATNPLVFQEERVARTVITTMVGAVVNSEFATAVVPGDDRVPYFLFRLAEKVAAKHLGASIPAPPYKYAACTANSTLKANRVVKPRNFLMHALTRINGVSDAMAIAIADIHTSVRALQRAFTDCTHKKGPAGMLADIVYQANNVQRADNVLKDRTDGKTKDSGRRIGPKVAARIYECLMEEDKGEPETV